MSSRIKTNIVNAVNAGMVAIVPKTNITFNDWTGCGYIIINPDTGAGAYMISGGLSGAFIYYAALFTLFILAAIGLTALTVLIAIYIGPVILSIISAINTIIAAITALTLWTSAWSSVAAFYISTYAIGLFILFLSGIFMACWNATPPALLDRGTGVCTFIVASIIIIINSLRH